ncbi:MAG: hypothetical protein QXT05_02275 [Candidatus Bilamarchaeaceae archaeon]
MGKERKNANGLKNAEFVVADVRKLPNRVQGRNILANKLSVFLKI